MIINDQKNDYESYTKWKGWIDNAPFGSLSVEQRLKYKLQLDKYKIIYNKINALEIGFGNGSFITFLQENGCNVTGIEVQNSLLEEAKLKSINVYDNINKINNKKFDLIAGFDVLEHLTIEELKTLFSSLNNILTDNATMIFRFPNVDSFGGMVAQNGDYTHITQIGITKLNQIVTQYGFKILKFEGEITYPRRYIVDSIRWIFRKAFTKLTGFGNNYCFSCNVIAIVVRQ